MVGHWVYYVLIFNFMLSKRVLWNSIMDLAWIGQLSWFGEIESAL